MHEELASIREVVSLPAREILDSAESFLSRLGYDKTQRTEYFLKAQRCATLESAGQDPYIVLVTASPQAAGGVQVAVHGMIARVCRNGKRSGRNGQLLCQS